MKRNTCSNCDWSDECAYGQKHPKHWCSEWMAMRIDPGGSLMAAIGVGMMVLGLIALLALWSCNRCSSRQPP